MNPCPSCHRQPGDGDFCEHCGQAVVAPTLGKPLSNGPALDAVATARELLKNARKQGTIGGAGATRERPPAWPTTSTEGADMDEDTPDAEAAF